MKNRSILFLLFVLFLLVTGTQTSNAAYVVKRTGTDYVFNPHLPDSIKTYRKRYIKVSWVKRKVVNPLKASLHSNKETGRNGNLALIFGLLCFIPFLPLCVVGIPLSIHFGRRGIRNNERFALTGLIMGLIIPIALCILIPIFIVGIIILI